MGRSCPDPGWPSARWRSTALLPTVSAELPERAIGRDTVEAIQSGVVLGHVAAIGGLVTRMTAELAGVDASRPWS